MEHYDADFSWPVCFKSRRLFRISWCLGECFGSKNFETKDGTWWYLCFYPLGDASFKREVCLRLCRQSSGKKIFVEGEIELSSSKSLEKFTIRQTLSKTGTYIRIPLYGILRDMYKKFPPSYDVYIRCKIKVCDMFEERCNSKSELSGEDDVPDKPDLEVETARDLDYLSSDLQTMYKNQRFADVTLVSGDTILRAHRNVLSARSQTFAKMFDQKSQKRADIIITIDNVKGNILEELISYIYTGRTKNLSYETAKDLFLAAKLYSLESLQRYCYDVLVSKLSLTTVLDLLLFADELENEEIKRLSLNFLSLHFAVAKKTEQWNNLIKQRPGLGIEILSFMMEANSKIS